MGFDLSKVLAAANEVVNQSSGGDYSGPPLVYPGMGGLTVRLLFNPKSQTVIRHVSRHKVDGKTLICASTYHQDCPLCVGIESYKNMTGSDMWTMDSKKLGLVMAQFIGVSKDYDNGGYQLPSKGDLICLMLPWSAVKALSEIIQRAGDRANEILTENEGKPILITKRQGSNIIEYRVEVDAFSKPYKSCENQEEFDEFLNDLPNLNDIYCPEQMPSDLLTKLQSEADALLSKVSNAQNAHTPVAQPGSEVPFNNSTSEKDDDLPWEGVSESGNTEACFGNFQNKNRTCLMCDRAIECSKETKKNK